MLNISGSQKPVINVLALPPNVEEDLLDSQIITSIALGHQKGSELVRLFELGHDLLHYLLHCLPNLSIPRELLMGKALLSCSGYHLQGRNLGIKCSVIIGQGLKTYKMSLSLPLSFSFSSLTLVNSST